MLIPIVKAHGYVAAAGVAAYFVTVGYMAFKVMNARKKYRVKYPTLYATEAEVKNEAERTSYNCVQRAHQNTLEQLPSFYMLLFLAGSKYPITSAAAGAVWCVGKVLYFNGYSSGNPEGRHKGALAYVGQLTLIGTCFKIIYDLLSQ